MRWFRRAASTVAIVFGLGLTALGSIAVWLDGRFDAGREAEAVVALAEDARLDVEVPTLADDGTFIRAIVWSDGGDYGIGDTVTVYFVESPKGLARLTGDQRLSTYGRWLLIGGVGLIVVPMAATILAARRRRRAGPDVLSDSEQP